MLIFVLINLISSLFLFNDLTAMEKLKRIAMGKHPSLFNFLPFDERILKNKIYLQLYDSYEKEFARGFPSYKKCLNIEDREGFIKIKNLYLVFLDYIDRIFAHDLSENFICEKINPAISQCNEYFKTDYVVNMFLDNLNGIILNVSDFWSWLGGFIYDLMGYIFY